MDSRSVFFVSIWLVSLSLTEAQQVRVDALSIGGVNTLTYTAGGSGQTVSVTMSATETGDADDGEVTKISIYFTNSDAFQDSNTVKSSAFEHTLTPAKDIPQGTQVTDLVADVASVLIDTANCQVYTHVCAVITATGDTNAADDFKCLPFGTTADTHAGTKKCPDVVAKASSFVITAPTPSSITYDTSKDTAITFEIEATAADGPGTVTGVKLYFTDKNDYDTAQTKSSAFDAGGVTSKTVGAGATEKITAATASLKLDAANCDKYTHLCAVLQITTTDTITNNNDVCNVFGTTAADAGSKACTDSASAIAAHGVLVMLLCMVTARLVI
ncbi:mucin-22-like isoform X2 [Ptychodera flava]|uniref:mucin-22-like isoform X2 n=1 Tax=Ptychodera flava TaxID=63121 RepID=UPI00396A9AAE